MSTVGPCEYAVDPTVAREFATAGQLGLFLDSFGIEKARLISKYPAAWSDSFLSNLSTDVVAALRRPLGGGWLSVLASDLLPRKMLASSGRSALDPRRTWLEQALEEHKRKPFHAILTKGTGVIGEKDGVLRLGDLGSAPGGLWDVRAHALTTRTAENIAASVRSLVSLSREVVLVDPHLQVAAPQGSRREPVESFLRTYQALMSVIKETHKGEQLTRVQVFLKIDPELKKSIFLQDCQDQLPKRTPCGVSVRLTRLAEGRDRFRKVQAGLHNRYVLTNVGGGCFPAGLGERKDRGYDDFFLLDHHQWKTRWLEYGVRGEFLAEDEVVIDGAKA